MSKTTSKAAETAKQNMEKEVKTVAKTTKAKAKPVAVKVDHVAEIESAIREVSRCKSMKSKFFKQFGNSYCIDFSVTKRFAQPEDYLRCVQKVMNDLDAAESRCKELSLLYTDEYTKAKKIVEEAIKAEKVKRSANMDKFNSLSAEEQEKLLASLK